MHVDMRFGRPGRSVKRCQQYREQCKRLCCGAKCGRPRSLLRRIVGGSGSGQCKRVQLGLQLLL